MKQIQMKNTQKFEVVKPQRLNEVDVQTLEGSVCHNILIWHLIFYNYV